MRDRNDAVLVGAGTVRADDPRLTTRGVAGGRDPLRVVLDGRLSISPRARVLPAIVLTSRQASAAAAARLVRAGATILRTPGPGAGQVDVAAALGALAERGVGTLLCEGGAETAAALLAAGCVDRVVLFMSPKILGGYDAIGAIGGRSPAHMADALGLTGLRLRKVGVDVMMIGDVHGARRNDRENRRRRR
jgi:diaminohydroxyphosphoribosylaminopyrimidine deaminase/5-amino-6-(5-phosphoribosylamino)uracil reductase